MRRCCLKYYQQILRTRFHYQNSIGQIIRPSPITPLTPTPLNTPPAPSTEEPPNQIINPVILFLRSRTTTTTSARSKCGRCRPSPPPLPPPPLRVTKSAMPPRTATAHPTCACPSAAITTTASTTKTPTTIHLPTEMAAASSTISMRRPSPRTSSSTDNNKT